MEQKPYHILPFKANLIIMSLKWFCVLSINFIGVREPKFWIGNDSRITFRHYIHVNDLPTKGKGDNISVSDKIVCSVYPEVPIQRGLCLSQQFHKSLQ